MIQYIGVIQVHETMQNKKVCWRFVWSGDAKRLIIGVPTQSVGTSKSKEAYLLLVVYDFMILPFDNIIQL